MYYHMYILPQVREYFLGVSMPVITSAAVVKIDRSTDDMNITVRFQIHYRNIFICKFSRLSIILACSLRTITHVEAEEGQFYEPSNVHHAYP